jgi:hypothetical protein
MSAYDNITKSELISMVTDLEKQVTQLTNQKAIARAQADEANDAAIAAQEALAEATEHAEACQQALDDFGNYVTTSYSRYLREKAPGKLRRKTIPLPSGRDLRKGATEAGRRIATAGRTLLHGESKS